MAALSGAVVRRLRQRDLARPASCPGGPGLSAAPMSAVRLSPARRVPRPLRLMRLVVLVGVVLLAVWAGGQVAQAVSENPPQGVVHVVEPGETVWEIVVDEYGGREQDVRLLVDQVLAANDLANAQLAPGQELVLPPAPH